MLTNLKKICNHPRLYSLDEEARLKMDLLDEPGLDPGAPLDPQHSGEWEGVFMCVMVVGMGWGNARLKLDLQDEPGLDSAAPLDPQHSGGWEGRRKGGWRRNVQPPVGTLQHSGGWGCVNVFEQVQA